MPTSFLISYPHVPVSALSVSITTDASVTLTDSEFTPFANTYYGERPNYFQLPATSTSFWATYDLGSGNTVAVNHVILGGASYYKSLGGTRMLLSSSSDNVTYTARLGTNANFQTKTFSGPTGDDIVFTTAVNDETGGTASAFRYWRIALNCGGAARLFPLSKVYFGSFFDMGKEPSAYDIVPFTDDEDTFRYPRGQVLMTNSAYPRHRVTIEYDGVSDAKVTELFAKVLKNPFKTTVFLYAATFVDPLYGNGLIYCRPVLDECSVTRTRGGTGDYNAVVLVFEEV